MTLNQVYSTFLARNPHVVNSCANIHFLLSSFVPIRSAKRSPANRINCSEQAIKHKAISDQWCKQLFSTSRYHYVLEAIGLVAVRLVAGCDSRAGSFTMSCVRARLTHTGERALSNHANRMSLGKSERSFLIKTNKKIT